MRPGFMSSVCPQQSLAQLIETAQRYGYRSIEFRTEWGHAHGVELGAPSAKLGSTRQALTDAGLAASCIATSVRFNAPDPADHASQRETLRRYVELAAEVGAPYIRTFSDGLPEGDPALRDRVLGLAASSYASIDDWAGQHGVVVLVETHTNMLGQWARQILDGAGAANVGVLWHVGHHLRRGQSVDEAYGYLQGHIHHVHFTAHEDPYVTDADNQRSFDLLAAERFDGYFSVEIIDPEDPEAVLAHHITKFHDFMEGANE